MACPKAPKIAWGNTFSKTLNIKYPLHNWIASSKAFEESTFVIIESGEEDAWIINTEYYLQGDVRFIPIEDTTDQTGWDDTDGWNDFLLWARKKNVFRFYPDKDSNTYIESYLVQPMDGAPTLEPDGTRTIQLYIRNATTSYDGY
jgi:hypothetical protein